MKALFRVIPILLVPLLTNAGEVNRQDSSPGETGILDPIADGSSVPVTSPKQLLDFQILDSSSSLIPFVLSSEIPGLPAVQATVKAIVQLAEDPGLRDPLPLPTLDLEKPAVSSRLGEISEAYPDSRLLFVSATVFNHTRTLLHCYSYGLDCKEAVAWSNLDFNHFGGFASFQVKDADGTLRRYCLMMAVGNEDLAEASEESKEDELPSGLPGFVITEGGSTESVQAIADLHALYRSEGVRMAAAYEARERAFAERKAYLLAHPPKPKDVVIRIWTRDGTASAGNSAGEGGAR